VRSLPNYDVGKPWTGVRVLPLGAFSPACGSAAGEPRRNAVVDTLLRREIPF
jgi:hypothetical protein